MGENFSNLGEENYINFIKNYIKEPMEILMVKNIITEMKNSLEGLKSGFQLAEKRISKLEDQ